MKKIILVCICILFATQIKARTLNLGTMQYPPYEYKENGKIKGIVVNIVRESFRRLKQPIKIKILPWVRGISYIKDGKIDGLFTMFKNHKREKFIDYHNEVLMPQIVSLFILKTTNIQWNGNISELAKYRFGGKRGFSYGKDFDNAIKNKIITKIEYVDYIERNVRKLLMKRFDIMINDKYTALYSFKKIGVLNHIKVLSPNIQYVPSYLGFSKKRKLTTIIDKFDVVLVQMKKDGTYNRIVNSF